MKSRAQQLGLGRRLVGWIAAYALVLHAVLAGAVATQLAATNPAGAGFELCLTGPDGAAIPGHGQTQHENCAIHCNTIVGGAPALAPAVVALPFPSPAAARTVCFSPIAPVDLLRRDGLGSRAPPLPA